MYLLALCLTMLANGALPLEWWCHLIHLMATWLADPCWMSRLSLDEFIPQSPFVLNHILVSTHAPNFGIRWFYSKITSHGCCMSHTSNHLFWSHTNFFGLLANLFRWPFLTKDIPKIMMFGHLMAIIPLTFWSTFPFQLVLIADLLTFPRSGWYHTLLWTNFLLLLTTTLVIGFPLIDLGLSANQLNFSRSILVPISGSV
jgi:hypothetical protein